MTDARLVTSKCKDVIVSSTSSVLEINEYKVEVICHVNVVRAAADAATERGSIERGFLSELDDHNVALRRVT